MNRNVITFAAWALLLLLPSQWVMAQEHCHHSDAVSVMASHCHGEHHAMSKAHVKAAKVCQVMAVMALTSNLRIPACPVGLNVMVPAHVALALAMPPRPALFRPPISIG